MDRILQRLHLILRCEEGQGITEYAVILVLVSIVGVTLLTAIGLRVTELLATARDAFP
jgi:Flp pilus assembly pilin Flp